MKLAQALQVRSELQNKADELRTRLNLNALYQEGEMPNEDPNVLLEELDKVVEQLEDIIYRIHLTNGKTETREGSLTYLLSKRDALTLQISIYKSLADQASGNIDRYSRKEIKILPSVDIRSLRKKIDKLSKDLRELEMMVQETNWLTDLL